ncbi:MAG: rhodanese-like domain-containing protein [Candidatus Competibacteraceae bacterium]|nr:rhodanese-like domain-containing protein [Candidatus Competibacteraceae bacterium]
MKRISLLIIVATFLLSTGCVFDSTSQGSSKSITASELINVNQAEFERLMKEKDVEIIDVRTQAEVSTGYIPGTKHFINFNSESFEKQLSQLDKSKTYIVYCRSGARSAQAGYQMTQKGFVKVYNLEGGILKWKGALSK